MNRQPSLRVVSFIPTKKMRQRASLALHPTKYVQCELVLIRTSHRLWQWFKRARAENSESCADAQIFLAACESVWAVKKAFRQEHGGGS
jgi:hypothetical protein